MKFFVFEIYASKIKILVDFKNFLLPKNNPEFICFMLPNPDRINTFFVPESIVFSHHLLNICVAKAEDDYHYVWGECENDPFSTLRKTELKSLNNVFAKYSKIKIIYKSIILLRCRPEKRYFSTSSQFRNYWFTQSYNYNSLFILCPLRLNIGL